MFKAFNVYSDKYDMHATTYCKKKPECNSYHEWLKNNKPMKREAIIKELDDKNTQDTDITTYT